jgi:hypothetical protein
MSRRTTTETLHRHYYASHYVGTCSDPLTLAIPCDELSQACVCNRMYVDPHHGEP